MTRTSANRVTCILAIFLFLAGSIIAHAAPRKYMPQPKKKWTFMLFMAADNNLEGGTPYDINELETVGSTKNVNFVVQLDRIGEYSQNSELKWGGTKRFYVTRDKNTLKMSSPEVADLGEVDMADPKALVDFVAWSKKNFPAERYALILWNHGTGWKEIQPSIMGDPGDTFVNVPDLIHYNISYDNTSGSSMNIPTLHETLAEVKEVLGQPLDLLGFDACLMQMFEVAYAAHPFALYQVGSSDLEPERGWPYDTIAAGLARKPAMTGKGLGSLIVSAYAKSYSMGSQGNTAVVLSLIDLSFVETFKQKLDAFCHLARSNIFLINQLEKARAESLKYVYKDYVDLGNFLGLLMERSNNSRLKKASRDLLSSIGPAKNRKTLLLSKAASGEKYKNSTGIAIFFPDREGFKTYKNRYKLLSMARETEWFEFLREMESPHTAYPKLEEIILVDENRDGRITKGEKVTVRVKLHNFGRKKASKVFLSGITSSPHLDKKRFVHKISSAPKPGKAATVEGFTFKVSDDAPEHAEVTLACRITGSGMPHSVANITFFVKPPFNSNSPVLLVLTDAFSPAGPVLQDMLQDAKIPFDVWDRVLDGDMKPDVLKRYMDGWVIVAVQDSSDQQVLTDNELRILTSYLRTGGRLVLTGQDLAFSLRDTSFLRDICRLTFVQDDINVHVVTGQDGFCRNNTFQIFGGDGANNQKWPDEVDPLEGAKAILRYNEGARDMAHDQDMIGPDLKPGSLSRGMKSTGTAAAKVVDGYRLLFFAFGIEAINSEAQRRDLVKSIQTFMEPKVGNELRHLVHSSINLAPDRAESQEELLQRVDLLSNLENRVTTRIMREAEKDPQVTEKAWRYIQSLSEDQRRTVPTLEKNLRSLLEFRRQHGTVNRR